VPNWNIPVTSRLDEQVEQAVQSGYAASKSELVRFAVVSYLRYLREEDEKIKSVHKDLREAGK
jgi:Arc/MetJ-type ribon-helix-helix transcriptional regulator